MIDTDVFQSTGHDDSDVAVQCHLEDAVETFDETLPSLEAAAEAMQTTLNDVLDLQHIETGKLRVQKRMAPMLPDMLLNTKQTFASQAEGAGVSLLTFDGHPSSGCMFSHDPPRIRGAVYNFVSNALKWSRPDEVLVRRLSDLRGRSASGKGGAVARPRVVVGCTELPPHLWGADAWRQARKGLDGRVCDRIMHILTLHKPSSCDEDSDGDSSSDSRCDSAREMESDDEEVTAKHVSKNQRGFHGRASYAVAVAPVIPSGPVSDGFLRDASTSSSSGSVGSSRSMLGPVSG